MKPWLDSIEYIRGVSMAGVVAIHIGSQYLLNPTPNIHLVALFEIVSRFSVPIFFFISAFGLFYRMNLAEPFEYGKFLRLPTFSRFRLRGGNLFFRAGEVSSLFPRDSDLVLSFNAAVDFFYSTHDAREIIFVARRADCL